MRSNYRRIGDYISEVKVRNSDGRAERLLGINIDKYFMPSVANTVGTDLTMYKLVNKNQFACNRMHVGRDYRLPISISKTDEEFMVSPAYDVFQIKNENELDPDFLMMWFSRKEFYRNAWFFTDADVRGGLSWKSFCDMQLPLPSIEKQREIVREYNVIQNRITLNQKLIQKLEETAQAIYKQWFVEFEFPNEDGKPYKSNGGEMVWNEELGKEIPKGWEVGKLSNIATIIMGQSPEGESYNKDGNGMIFYQGRTDFDTRFPHITTYTTQPKKKALKDDILISVRAPVGDLNIATKDCAIGRGLGALRSKLKCNSHLFYTLQSLKSHFDISDGEGTIFGSINKDELHNIQLTYSEYEIKNFEYVSLSIDTKIKNFSFENRKLSELKELLLSKLATLEG
jgi:type I restriction enzyme, S subunit